MEPLHGLSYVDPAYVDPRGAPYVDSLTWTLLMWTPLRGAPYVGARGPLLMWTYPWLLCGHPTWWTRAYSLRGPCLCGPVEPLMWTTWTPTWSPLRGLLSYVDPAYVDSPLRGPSYYVDPGYVDPLHGAPYVDSPTWALLMWTPLRGARYVDSLTWTLLMWTTTWSPLRGLSWLCGRPYVESPMDSPTWTMVMWTPLRGARYVDSLTWTLLMWSPLRGAPTWTLLRGPPTWSPLRGLSWLCGRPYVESPTWTLLRGPWLCGSPPTWSPLRGLSYVDTGCVEALSGPMWRPWPILCGFMWSPWLAICGSLVRPWRPSLAREEPRPPHKARQSCCFLLLIIVVNDEGTAHLNIRSRPSPPNIRTE